jgi:hypothetical protein
LKKNDYNYAITDSPPLSVIQQSDPHNPNNYPVYIVDQDLGNCMLSIDDDIDVRIDESCTKEQTEKEKKQKGCI